MLKGMVLGMALAFSAGAAMAQNADFMLVNRTGYPIREVYVSPTHDKNWGDDKLGRHVLDEAHQVMLRFPARFSQCKQDIKVVFDDDNSEVTWEDFNLCDISKITLRYNRRSGETTANYE